MTGRVSDEMLEAAVREFQAAFDLALGARMEVALEAALRRVESSAVGDLSPMRVESHGSCDVGPLLASQWRNGGHWHTVWPEGESWCFRTVEEAVDRAAEVRDIWAEHPHLAPVSGAVAKPDDEPIADVDPARYWREIAERNASERDGWRDAFTSLNALPVAEHEQEVRADEVERIREAIRQVHPNISAYRKAQSAIGDLDREHIDVLAVGSILSALRREVIDAYDLAARTPGSDAR